MRRAVLLYYPASGRRRSPRVVPAIRSVLTADTWQVDLLRTEGPGTAPEQLSRAVAAGSPDAVFVYGGDGTLREAAQGLLGTGIPFAPLPGGTTNVICDSLGLPRDPVAAAALLSRSRPREIAVGRLDDRIFLMQLSAGLDAAVLAAVDSEAKARWGRAPVTRVTIEAPEGTPFQIDGDPCSVETPVTVQVGDEPLPALLPPSRWRSPRSSSAVPNPTF